MILRGYAVYDRKSEEYSLPTYYPNVAVALRHMKDLLAKSDIHSHFPDDFDVVFVGYYNTVAGICSKPEDQDVFKVSVSDLLNKPLM